MLYFSRLKTALILGACVLGVLLAIPNLFAAPVAWLPWRTIHLGLDLRGGSYLLMEVDMGAVVKERLDGLADQARRAMDRAGVRPYTITADPQHDRLVVKTPDVDKYPAVQAALGELVTTSAQGIGARPDLELATTPDGVTVTLSPVALNDRATQAVQQSIEIVRRRIDETGVLDPVITRQGTNRIVVQLPGIEDPGRIKALLGKTARMTFRLTDENANMAASPPPGVEYLPYQDKPGQMIAVRKRVEVDGGDLTDARAGQNSQTGEWVVNFRFNGVGTRRFADISRANVGHQFAVVLDNKVITAPVIREPITGGTGQISGNFTAASATDLAVLLRAGALPAPLTVVEERSVGPELGADAIRAGALSLAAGFVLVIIFMGVFYGFFGWIANLALVFNLILMMAVLSLLNATLTLARHGRHPADARHGGRRQHPDQRAHPRGGAQRPHAAECDGDRIPARLLARSSTATRRRSWRT